MKYAATIHWFYIPLLALPFNKNTTMYIKWDMMMPAATVETNTQGTLKQNRKSYKNPKVWLVFFSFLQTLAIIIFHHTKNHILLLPIYNFFLLQYFLQFPFLLLWLFVFCSCLSDESSLSSLTRQHSWSYLSECEAIFMTVI